MIKCGDLLIRDKIQKLYRIDTDINTPKCTWGERGQEYQRKGIYKIFCDLADYVYGYREYSVNERKTVILKKFNKLVEDDPDTFQVWKIKEPTFIDDNFFTGLYLSKSNEFRGEMLIKEFNNAYKAVRCDKDAKKNFYLNYEDANRYLNSYLDLCGFLFSSGSIFREEVRSHKLIEKLLNIELDETEGFFSFLSPFALFSILRTLEYIAALPDEICDIDISIDGTQKLNRRKQILATYAIHSFSRFTIHQGKSYIVNYSRRKAKIICKNSEKCSSIESVKPIRLLEKIVAHLTNIICDNKCFFNGDKINLKVSIVGFASVITNGNDVDIREIIDLIYEVFSWFEDIKKKGSIPAIKDTVLNLELNYFRTDNSDNFTESNNDLKEKNILTSEYEYKNQDLLIGNCKLQISENKHTDFDKEKLSQTISSSDIVFLLDCPWLAIEDFNALNEGDIYTYIKKLNNSSYLDDIEKDRNGDDHTRSIFSKDHIFYSLNDQLNRVAIDNFVKYGRIVRVPKNYLIEWIVEEMKRYGNRNIYKTVYLYNSSVRGILLSDCVDYPIIREEIYNNKKFNIMRFSSRPNRPLPVENSRPIEIELWSLLKYVDVSFVFIAIKDYFSEQFYKFADVPLNLTKDENQEEILKGAIERDIISICRSILFEIHPIERTEPMGRTQINIRIAIDRPISTSSNFDEIKNHLGTLYITKFFENIIKNVIFKNSKGFGDNCIRDAFESCLYSKSSSVRDLFLWYDYRLKRKENQLNRFIVDFNPTLITTKIELKESAFDSFSDKRLYARLLDYLSMPSPPTHLIFNALKKADGLYMIPDKQSHSEGMLNNIVSVYGSDSTDESYLIKNTKKILNIFN